MLHQYHYTAVLVIVLLLHGIVRAQAPEYFSVLQTEKVLSTGEVQWTQFGPGSAGYCDIVEYHPTDPNCLIMSPDVFNSYRSLDNGASWHTIRDCDGTSLGLWRMRDISFSLQNPDYGVAIDERGWFWETRDRGGQWQRNHDFSAKGVCSVVTLDPENDQIIYVGSGNFWNVKWNKRTLASPRREIPKPNEHYVYLCDFEFPLQQFYQNTRQSRKPCEFDPQHYSNTDYAHVSVTEYGKVWRSTDGGTTWKVINAGLPEAADIGRILFHPLDSKILYMATNYGLYKSDNRGETWLDIGGNLPHNMLRDMAIYLDENTKKPVLVVIDQVFWEEDGNGGVTSTGGVFKSVDEGKTWESLNSNLYLDLTKVSDYVQGSWYRAIGRWFELSSDEKARWADADMAGKSVLSTQELAKRKYPILPRKALQNFNRLTIDPSNPQRMYLGHSVSHDISFHAGDLWKTDNAGKSWIMCNRTGGEWQGVDKNFWQDRGNPANPNMQFAHLQRQVMEQTYGGKMGCRALTINSRGDLITVMEQQALQSTDHGETWQQIDNVETSPGSGCWIGTGCSNLTRCRYHMDPRMPDQFLLLCGEHGLWQMCNDENDINPKVPAIRQIVGQSQKDSDPHSIATVAYHPHNTDIMYLQSYRQQHAGYIRRSVDGGKTWENISQPVKFTIAVATGKVMTHSYLIDPVDPQNMYFCTPSWDMYTEKKQNPGFHNYGVYRSQDEGYTWEIVNSGLPAEANVTYLCFDPDNPAVLYAAVMKSMDMKTKGGLYVSKDRGDSWNALPIPSNIESVNHIHIDKQSDKIYIACGLSDGNIKDGGVWVRADKGDAWQKIFHMPFIQKVNVSPVDSKLIAVAVGENTEVDNLNGGAYLSLDGGQTWHKSNNGLGQAYWIVDIQWDLTKPNVIWCGLFGSGWYKGVLNEK
jgi:photosystem II stability/assembly factor-like uncharacterized protein